MNFTPDPRYLQIAEAYSLDCIDFVKKHCGQTLDWSDESIRHVETALELCCKEMPAVKPSEEQIYTHAKMFGSYVGETFRKNHGATWGIVTIDGDSFPGMKSHKGEAFWPWGRAQKRLKNGAEDNIWHYYQWLVKNNGNDNPSPSPEPAPPPKKHSWLQRFLGS